LLIGSDTNFFNQSEMDWRKAWIRNFAQTRVWRSPPEAGATTRHYLVGGMRDSGKTTFLRGLLSAFPKDSSNAGGIMNTGVNVIRIKQDDGSYSVLMETRRPVSWYGPNKFNGETVVCVVFVVNSTQYLSFAVDAKDQVHEERQQYDEMITTYKRFHGIIGEAFRGNLRGVVLANKYDEARELSEGGKFKEDPVEIVSRKLRIQALRTCGWYRDTVVRAWPMTAVEQDSCKKCMGHIHTLSSTKGLFWSDRDV
jgi:hypothetical protein